MPRVTLTKAERKAGMDLRDVLPRAVKPRVSKQTKRENAAADGLRRDLETAGFGDTNFEVENIEGSEREDVEVEVVIRFYLYSKAVDASVNRPKRQTHVQRSKREAMLKKAEKLGWDTEDGMRLRRLAKDL